MTMTRAIAFASLAALIGGAVPPAALAAAMPPLAPSPPAARGETPPPVPAAAAAEAQWYVVIDGQAVGPLSDEAVIRRLDNGEIAPDTLVWRAGMSEWQSADTAMPLVAKRVEAALKHPKPPARTDQKFVAFASLR